MPLPDHCSIRREENLPLNGGHLHEQKRKIRPPTPLLPNRAGVLFKSDAGCTQILMPILPQPNQSTIARREYSPYNSCATTHSLTTTTTIATLHECQKEWHNEIGKFSGYLSQHFKSHFGALYLATTTTSSVGCP